MKLLNSILHVHEYMPMDDKGYQYCKTCGKAFYIGLPPEQPNWKIQERIEFSNKQGKIYKITFVQQCSVTGELKSFSIKY